MISIKLEALESGDMDICRQWRNDSRVWAWCRQNDLLSDVDQKRWFERQSADPTIKMYRIVVESQETGDGNKPITKRTFIGVAGFTSIDLLNRRAEFSLYISPAIHGRGFGKAALSVLLMHGFQNYGFNVIWGETFDGNPAARMFERLGMVKEGTRRQFYMRDGRMIDAHIYSITRDEWKASLLRQQSQSSSESPESQGFSSGESLTAPSQDLPKSPSGASSQDP